MGEVDGCEDRILFRQIKSVKIGQSERFKIHYNPQNDRVSDVEEDAFVMPKNIWVKIKNTQSIALRAAYLAGPYVLYVDCKSEDYSTKEKYFVTADQPVFEPQLLPGQSFYVELSCHTLKPSYCWVVDIISQILFNNTIEVDFEIMIGTSKKILHESSLPENNVLNSDKIGLFADSSILHVDNLDTYDLWNLPIPNPSKKIHLVILTHGIHSNVSGDMLYLKEEIDKLQNDDVVVKGFFGNVGKTERGIKYLGSRVAEYVGGLVYQNESFNNGKVDRISFIGHSLGGLIQTFTLAYLHINYPDFFKNIKPINFITIASPLLGIVNENPLYVKLALLAGIVGKSGQDLGLKYVEKNAKPLLVLLPSGPTHTILKRFKRRTVYANAINDGLVPLRTSALLYLDYQEIFELFKSPNEENDVKVDDGIGKIPLKQTVLADETSKFLVQGMLTFFMPQKHQTQPNLTYLRFQTESQKESDSSENFLPTSTFIDAIPNIVLPPLPSMKYIVDPDTRENIILHDKVYREKDLPKFSDEKAKLHGTDEKVVSTRLTNLKKRILDTIDNDVEHLEEEIAREYHKGMSWRKVIVKLKPDAHNNIIVRRRFANAYGWPVIEHLVENHFSHQLELEDLADEEESHADSLDSASGLKKIISRELISKQNIEIESEEPIDESQNQWVNTKDGESFFAVGPGGLLSDVSEMVFAMRDHWYNFGKKPAKDDERTQTSESLQVPDQLMSDFNQ